MEKQKVIFSGAQPTGSLTLGNYIGAIQNWKALEKDYNCLYSIVDLHSLTVRHDPKAFMQANLSFLAQYLASGLDPEKNIIFFQSHVPQHAELSWILSCNTYMGELNRMTQFKEKSDKHKDNINAGLFTYPALMAADILLYKTNLVPVGEDQKQHLELTRDIALRLNNVYGDIFEIPEVYIPKVGARIMSLQEPTKKMSKSDDDVNGTIYLLDPNDVIIKKFKRAVTDNENKVVFRDEQPGIKNLMTIYSKLGNLTLEEVEAKYQGKGYGAFKTDVGELIVDYISPFKQKYEEYMNNSDYLEKIYKSGAERAREIAERTMVEVREKLGLVKL
ncbi:tryptophan--tRNA ligase [Serpentinicella alkaliphila]|uniref:Tryptophan--tRNA ligase n=1 Tax=Serpentinicella alkaliphila TaxID=1734049 RepID=A0A4R2TKW4_9FIRM|nr:tryptophan--tRNA ligase [Serpentinicella alkaliphila]QUH24676.1 tryptophan--tRNA ligase [Serpentinicella alkaliphila]TCQ03062.1 tryptophanyl-tRNA synthetase [Serpentinicella alkaliphila]